MNRTDPGADGDEAIAWFARLIEESAEQRQWLLQQLRRENVALAQRVEQLVAADACPNGVLEEGLAALAAPALRKVASASADLPAAHRSGERVGPWCLQEVLGTGGMGEVWLAERRDGQFQQRVAIKLLKRGMDSDAVLRRFQREREILARLEHPGIARLIDGGMTGSGLPYFAMEYVQGLPITEFADTRMLDLRARAQLIVGLCAAVDFANRRLIVHRDLKPSNIFVLGDGSLKVLDFGIAKMLDEPEGSGVTQTSTRAMSPAYAAPEQLFGEAVAIATDVYAIGLVLFELLCGSLPHGRGINSLAEVSAEIARDTTARPSAVRSLRQSEQRMSPAPTMAIQADLDLIVLQALRREPERRYRSAADLAEDLQRWLDQRPIRARPAAVGYRFRKFIARNRMAAAMALTAMIAVLGALWTIIDEREAALQSATRASIAAQRAERAKQFLVSLFDRADIYSKNNQGTRTVVDLLEAVPARLITELEGEPGIQVDLLVTVAGNLRQAGRQDSAERALRQALSIAENSAGVDPLTRATALKEIGFIETSQGNLTAAQMHLEAALAIYLQQPGDQRNALISTRTGLATNASSRGALEESLEMRKAILLDRIALKGERDADVAMDYSNLATSLSNLGRYAEAVQALQRAHSLLADLLGPSHLRTLYVLSNLALVQTHRGHLEEAQLAAEKVLRDAVDVGNARSRASARLVLALVAFHRGQWDVVLRETEQILRAESTSVIRIGAFRLAGRMHLRLKRFDLAVESLQQALTELGRESATSMTHLWTRLLYQAARHGIERDAQSLATLREAFANMTSTGRAGGIDQFDASLLVGQVERDAGEYGRALDVHRTALLLTERSAALGTLGQALAHAEIALDLLARDAPGDRQAAGISAQRAMEMRADIIASDPRFAVLNDLVPKRGPR